MDDTNTARPSTLDRIAGLFTIDRIARLFALVGFFTAAFMIMFEHEGTRYYVGGALLFGALIVYLWKDERQAQADARVNKQVSDQAAANRAAGESGVPTPNSGSWTNDF